MSVLSLFSFLSSTINQGPEVGKTRYYHDNAIFKEGITACGDSITCGNSLIFKETAICGDTFIVKNPIEKNPAIPNLFVDGNIFGFKNLTIANVSTFNNTIIANRNIIANAKITLAGCGDVAERINRADTLPSSDLNLKENVTPIKNALDKVQKLNGVEFDFKSEDDYGYLEKHQIGLIAQDVQKVIPEIVAKKENGNLGVSYQHLTALLIEAVKEQQDQINELRKEIKELKGGNLNESTN